VRSLTRPRIGPLLILRVLFSSAFSMFQAAFSLWGSLRLGLDAAGVGGVLTYVGFITVFVQGYMVGKLTDRFSETILLFWASVGMAIGLVGWAVSPSIPVLFIALIPVSVAGGIFNTVINSALTKAASRKEAGGILGISASLESFTRVIGPILGNGLLGLSTLLPGILGAVLTGVSAIFVWNRIIGREGDTEKAKIAPRSS